MELDCNLRNVLRGTTSVQKKFEKPLLSSLPLSFYKNTKEEIMSIEETIKHQEAKDTDDSQQQAIGIEVEESASILAEGLHATDSEAAAQHAQDYYYQQFQQQHKNIIATEVTRDQIVGEFQKIITLHKYDPQDMRFPLQIAKVFPLIQIYCYQQQEQIAKMMANEFWQSPVDPNGGVVGVDPSSTIAPVPVEPLDTIASASSVGKPPSKKVKKTSMKPPSETALSGADGEQLNLKDDQSRVKREMARQTNPHLTRARSLIARAKLVLGPDSPELEIKALAIQLLHQPRRTPKPQYRFDEYGNALVIEYINAWTNTKARRSSTVGASESPNTESETGSKRKSSTSDADSAISSADE